jgi:RNA polymerase sigma factor (sigma-70 family)
MQMLDDAELLGSYARERSESAFTELVRRRVDLVYSAALREARGDAALAEDITQAVFVELARKAAKVSQHPALAAWLYTCVRRMSANVRRSEDRRQHREQEAHTMNELLSSGASETAWQHVQPVLDDAMHELSETDRSAVVLRFFEERSLKEVGLALGLNENAARMRVERALEKLRTVLAKRGVTSTASTLAAALAAGAVMSAPAGLAATISSAALASAAVGAGTTLTLMTMTKLKLGIIGTVVLAGVATPLLLQHQAQVELRDENQSLRQLVDQLNPLAAENERLSNLLAQANRSPAFAPIQSNELLRLRGEVARLRDDAKELARLKSAGSSTSGHDPAIEATLKTWAAWATRLKQGLNQMPDKRIPELQLLTEKDWLDAVKNAKQMETDEDMRVALNNLRNSAKQQFGEMTRNALKKYADANSGQIPGDLSQLKPYFDKPVDDAMLQRYKLLQTGKLADAPSTGDNFLFVEQAPPVDDEYDSFYQFRMNGTRTSSVSRTRDDLRAAATEYAKANNGLLPRDASQISPYLRQAVDPDRVQKFLGKIPPNVTTLDQAKAIGF